MEHVKHFEETRLSPYSNVTIELWRITENECEMWEAIIRTNGNEYSGGEYAITCNAWDNENTGESEYPIDDRIHAAAEAYIDAQRA